MPKEAIMGGDILQVTNPEHPWFGCLLIVDEVKTWGVLAYVTVPKSNDASEPPVLAYNRLKDADYEKVGHSVVDRD